ncbi:unnamed protein product [Lactuca saligna]|uniref:Uncharacterized protein n=1 Tax=Lactuca saligna TaxID=75948 RepID=A0AA35ZV49_LACSI|nr:unnamed protein product [Lactuca saligna]
MINIRLHLITDILLRFKDSHGGFMWCAGVGRINRAPLEEDAEMLFSPSFISKNGVRSDRDKERGTREIRDKDRDKDRSREDRNGKGRDEDRERERERDIDRGGDSDRERDRVRIPVMAHHIPGNSCYKHNIQGGNNLVERTYESDVNGNKFNTRVHTIRC